MHHKFLVVIVKKMFEIGVHLLKLGLSQN